MFSDAHIFKNTKRQENVMTTTRLERALIQQVDYFKQTSHPIGRIAFELSNGKDCLRVEVQLLRQPERVFLNCGYFSKGYGYREYSRFKQRVKEILKSQGLNPQGFNFSRRLARFVDSFAFPID